MRKLSKASRLILSRYAGLVAIVLLVALPMLWAVGYAALYSVGGIGYFSQGWSLEHWRSATSGYGIAQSLALSFGIATIVTSIVTCVSLGIVISFPEWRQHAAFYCWAGMLLATPTSVTAFMVLVFLGSGGLLSRLAFRLNAIESPAEFPELTYDQYSIGIVIAQTIGSLPLMLFYLSQLWKTIKADRLLVLSQTLGSSFRQAKWRVVMPTLLYRSRAVIVLIFLFTLGSYEVPLLLGRQSPQMFSVLAQRYASHFDLLQKPQAFVLASLYFVISTLLLVVYLRWRRRDAM